MKFPFKIASSRHFDLEEIDAINQGAQVTTQSLVCEQLNQLVVLHLQFIYFIHTHWCEYVQRGHDACCCTQGICALLGSR